MFPARDLLHREIENVNFESKNDKPQAAVLAKLPLVICGPILRKVCYKSISVWLAFKEAVSDITLEIFDSEDASKKPVITGKTAAPIRIGKNAFVTLVTAVGGDNALKSGIIYGYNISFSHSGKIETLNDSGVLTGNISSISYGKYTYPTFCLPGDTLDDVKIVHGSCRKPHGGKTDALRALDTMLEVSNGNCKERPQLLCLTGDQIYADDVSTIVHYRIQKVRDLIFGWKEKLPTDVKTGKDYTDGQLMTGNRKAIIAKSAEIYDRDTGKRKENIGDSIGINDLTTTDSKNHLVYLDEFISMYLLAFSDTFWHDDEASLSDYLSAERLAIDPDIQYWREEQEAAKLYAANKQHKLAKEYTKEALRNQATKNVFKNWAQEKSKDFSKEKASVENFRRSLPYVKRALANVSTLMIFDDHDITDDWFMTKQWTELALTPNTLSRRYILNGMLAYVLFQDWGNDYSKYGEPMGAQILEALTIKDSNTTDTYLGSIERMPNKHSGNLEEMILPKLIQPPAGHKGPVAYLSNKFHWDYKISYNCFNLIALNTRSARAYFDKEKPVGSLILPGVLEKFRPIDPGKLLVLVSAAPIFGNVEIEVAQEKTRIGGANLAAIYSRYKSAGGMYDSDQEAWSFSNLGFSSLLRFLADFKRTLILSGDVHYAYTAYVKLWKAIDGKKSFAEIVQATSSALKNSSKKTHEPAHDEWYYRFEPESGVYKMVRVTARQPDSKFSLDSINNPRFASVRNLISGGRPLFSQILIDTTLQYNLQYVDSAGADYTELLRKIFRTRQAGIFPDHSNMEIYANHNKVIGKDNISVITFKGDSIKNSIWFASGNKNNPDDLEYNRMLFPHINHSISFGQKSNGSPIDDLQKNTGLKITSSQTK